MAASKPATVPPARLLAGLFVGVAILAGGPATGAQPIPLASVDRACDLIGKRLLSVDEAKCKAAQFQVGAASREGQPLLYRDYLPQSQRAPGKRVLLIGGIHGDELSSVSIVFQWIERIAGQRFQPFHWRVIPCANPDGLLRRPPLRVNRRGVDLNRNFPTADWTADALGYWRHRTGSDPRRYPGPHALSEPETLWLTQMIEDFDPHAIISVHAPYGVLDFDGPTKPPAQFGYLRLHQLGTYPGSLGNYAGVNRGLPVITLELPSAGTMPTAAQSARIWADMLAWLDRNLRAQPGPPLAIPPGVPAAGADHP